MNIRRFVAADMRKVLREVRSALGSEAVILSTKNVDDGVEVIAAVDYDDTLFARWAEPDGRREDTQAREWADVRHDEPGGHAAEAVRSPADTYARVAAAVEERDAGREDRVELRSVPPEVPRPAAPISAVPPPPKAGQASVPPGLAAEISDLRELLERQLTSLAWNDTNRRNPAYARTLRQFAKLGLDPAVARTLAARMPRALSRDRTWRMPLQLLAERLPLAKQDLVDLNGTFAVIGPTGVGKTTTIAKIAARFALRYGIEHLGLVTTDGYRIGARDQLMTFARILGTPMHVANDAGEMRAVLASLSHKRLILVDTAGMSQRDTRLAQQFAALGGADSDIKTVLALSAAADLGCLRDALRVFRAARPVGLIATKIDEAASLGPILSLVLESRLPLAYLCDGQRVPEDLHLAGHRRAWIIRTAMELARDKPRVGGEDELASAYGGMGLAANG